MKQILVPTDFSENAWNAIVFAKNLFKDQECVFHFLHTYTPAFYRVDYIMGGPEFSAIPDSGVERSLAGLEKTKEKIERLYPNPKHRYNTLASFNTLTDEISEVTKERNIEAIVMGTQGATGAVEIFLGTNTVHVLRKAKIPVLVVPNGYSFTAVNSILFPTDYWSDYKVEELGFLLDFAQDQKAEIVVFHANEEHDLTEAQQKNKMLLSTKLKEIKHRFVLDRDNLMPNAVYKYINDNNTELLAMMNRKHNFFERLIIKQHIDAFGFHIDIPFLVIPDTANVSK
nr:universal stress protein [Allomuricauda sp.]